MLLFSCINHNGDGADRKLPKTVVIISDVKRGSKNRNSLQFRVLEIEFLNSKLDFTF